MSIEQVVNEHENNLFDKSLEQDVKNKAKDVAKKVESFISSQEDLSKSLNEVPESDESKVKNLLYDFDKSYAKKANVDVGKFKERVYDGLNSLLGLNLYRNELKKLSKSLKGEQKIYESKFNKLESKVSGKSDYELCSSEKEFKQKAKKTSRMKKSLAYKFDEQKDLGRLMTDSYYKQEDFIKNINQDLLSIEERLSNYNSQESLTDGDRMTKNDLTKERTSLNRSLKALLKSKKVMQNKIRQIGIRVDHYENALNIHEGVYNDLSDFVLFNSILSEELDFYFESTSDEVSLANITYSISKSYDRLIDLVSANNNGGFDLNNKHEAIIGKAEAVNNGLQKNYLDGKDKKSSSVLESNFSVKHYENKFS